MRAYSPQTPCVLLNKLNHQKIVLDLIQKFDKKADTVSLHPQSKKPALHKRVQTFDFNDILLSSLVPHIQHI